MAKEKPVCRTCGSEEVVADGWLMWSQDDQEWIIENKFDDYFCHTCEGECSVDWVDADS